MKNQLKIKLKIKSKVPIRFDATPFKIVLGTFGGSSEMGTKCKTFSHSVPTSVKEDFSRLPNAYAAIAVGVAEHGQHGLATQKFTVEASSVLQCWLTMRNYKIHQRNAEPWRCYAKVHYGSIISAPMLVADEKSRAVPQLRNYPSGVIGGETEGGVLLEIQNKYNAYIELIAVTSV